MNGRIYSPSIGRMLSPDPVTQEPENGQNYNRYTYAFNNPLKYTDPSGYQSCIETDTSKGKNVAACQSALGQFQSPLLQSSFPSHGEIDQLDILLDFVLGDFDHLRANGNSSSNGCAGGLALAPGACTPTMSPGDINEVHYTEENTDSSDIRFIYGLRAGYSVRITDLVGVSAGINLGSREISLVTGNEYVSQGGSAELVLPGVTIGQNSSRSQEIHGFEYGEDSVAAILSGQPFETSSFITVPGDVSANDSFEVNISFEFFIGLDITFDIGELWE